MLLGAELPRLLRASPRRELIGQPDCLHIGANINASRHHEFQINYVYGSLSAARVTERWKANIRVSENYKDQIFHTRSRSCLRHSPT